MNTYVVNGSSFQWTGSITKAEADQIVSAVVIGSTMSPNFDSQVIVTNNAGGLMGYFRFDLPFSIANLINPSESFNNRIINIVYDTRFQGVKEFLDKPYAVAGRVVGFIVDNLNPNVYDYAKDLDQFQRFTLIRFQGPSIETPASYDLVIGIVNSTLTESYAPLGARNGNVGAGLLGVKFYETADLVIARNQIQAQIRQPSGSALTARVQMGNTLASPGSLTASASGPRLTQNIY